MTAAKKTELTQISTEAIANAALEPDLLEILEVLHATETAPNDFTIKAAAALKTSHTQFLRDVVNVSGALARADGLENVSERHVTDAVRKLRSNKKGSDWFKSFGFFFMALSAAQWRVISDQNPIAKTSVNWLVVDVVLTVVCLSTAFFVDEPFEKVKKIFRRKKENQTKRRKAPAA